MASYNSVGEKRLREGFDPDDGLRKDVIACMVRIMIEINICASEPKTRVDLDMLLHLFCWFCFCFVVALGMIRNKHAGQ